LCFDRESPFSCKSARGIGVKNIKEKYERDVCDNKATSVYLNIWPGVNLDFANEIRRVAEEYYRLFKPHSVEAITVNIYGNFMQYEEKVHATHQVVSREPAFYMPLPFGTIHIIQSEVEREGINRLEYFLAHEIAHSILKEEIFSKLKFPRLTALTFKPSLKLLFSLARLFPLGDKPIWIVKACEQIADDYAVGELFLERGLEELMLKDFENAMDKAIENLVKKYNSSNGKRATRDINAFIDFLIKIADVLPSLKKPKIKLRVDPVLERNISKIQPKIQAELRLSIKEIANLQGKLDYEKLAHLILPSIKRLKSE
jgi:hypothetical protein